MDGTYAEIGTQVILGKSKYWSSLMSPYTGKKATIIRVMRLSGELFCRVDIDGDSWSWDVQAMYLATDEPLLRK